MQDKGHCKMLHEGDVLLEYADFYDYRSETFISTPLINTNSYNVGPMSIGKESD
jgi:hypothetical protein